MMASPNPALPSPPRDGDRNRGSSILVTESIFLAIATILFLARLYVRSRIPIGLGLDDLSVGLGLVFAIVVLVIDIIMVHYGVGRHQFYLELSPQLLLNLSQALKWQYISEILYLISTMFTRVSICFFLLRIFGTKRKWKNILYGIMAFSVVTSISTASLVLAPCSPVQKLWNTILPGTCWTPNAHLSLGYYNGTVAVLCDWTLASLPIVFLWNLQMSTKLKVGICLLMSMGFFSGVCAILRTVVYKNLDATDVTWNLVPLVIWAILEETIDIIAACIPTVKPLFNNSFRFPWSTGSWSRGLAGKESGHPGIEEDDRRRLHPALQQGVHLNILPSIHEVYLGDDRRERNKVEIQGGGQTSRRFEGIGLGKDDIRMETVFGAYKGESLDAFDRV